MCDVGEGSSLRMGVGFRRIAGRTDAMIVSTRKEPFCKAPEASLRFFYPGKCQLGSKIPVGEIKLNG